MGVVEQYVNELSDEEILSIISAADQQVTPENQTLVRHVEKLTRALDKTQRLNEWAIFLSSEARKVKANR